MDCVGQLLSISSDPIGKPLRKPGKPDIFDGFGELGCELRALLARRNGFWAYESALLLRPAMGSTVPLSIEEWNDSALWLDSYQSLALPELLYFSEDVFGEQFALSRDSVVSCDPETGERKPIASSIDEWIVWVMGDYAAVTGYPLAHDWQVAHGPLPPGKRLVPRIPFVCGGEFAIENLGLMSDVQSMRFRGLLASQLLDLPEGAQIEFEITDE